MKKAITLVILLFASLHVCSAQDISTKGTNFWFSFMENLNLLFNGPPQFTVYIHSEESGTGTFGTPYTGFSIDVSFEANQLTEIILPDILFYAEGSEEIKNFGLKLELSAAADVFVVHNRIYFHEASSVLPEAQLGTSYIVTAIEDTESDVASASSFVIAATKDNSEITITPSTLTAGLRPEGLPFTIELDAGQSYQVQATGDLTNTRIESTEKIAVFAGAKKANISCTASADNHVFDQILPIERAATSYALIPFKTRGFTTFKVLATVPNTELYRDGIYDSTLENAGDFIEYENATPFMLTSSQPIFVTQLNPSQECAAGVGDPNMLTLVSSELKTQTVAIKNFTGFGENQNIFTGHYVNLFAKTEDLGQITIDNENVSDQFEAFPNNPTYSYAQIDLIAGTDKILADFDFLAYAYGFGDYDAYTYHLAYQSDNIVSTNEFQTEAFEIYPNPANDFLNVKLGKLESTKITISDPSGRLIKTFTNSFNKINISNLEKGVYLLTLETKNASTTKRFLK